MPKKRGFLTSAKRKMNPGIRQAREIVRLKKELADQGKRIEAQVKNNTALRKERDAWAEGMAHLLELFKKQTARIKELEKELAAEKAANGKLQGALEFLAFSRKGGKEGLFLEWKSRFRRWFLKT